jgi:antitoxin component YwqK of YwqJK toxin-antitoxin module
MNKPKDITPVNNKGQRHGLWKVYSSDGSLSFEGNFNNNKQQGIWLYCNYQGNIKHKLFYI